MPHEFLGEPEAAVCAHYAERGDVAVLDAIGGLFFHFGEHVAYDFGWVVGGFGGPGDLLVGVLGEFWFGLLDSFFLRGGGKSGKWK